jgi:hypothetical protein
MNVTAKQIYRGLTKKLRLENVRSSREQYGDYYLDGKYQFRVIMPNIHGGSGSVSDHMLKICRDSVRLSMREFSDLVRCPMTSERYEEIIRALIKKRGSAS